MASTTDTHVPNSAIAAHSVVAAVLNIQSRMQRWLEIRRTVRALEALDADQLDDLGLTPGDIEHFARTGRF